jgi:radical SAM protein with 4Fe4S-binding SPASM domain
MVCDKMREEDREFIKGFNQKAAQLRVPVSGSIDLTHRCNLRCVHCYLGDHKGQGGLAGLETGTARTLSLIDEITEAGCLFLLITGGEPLLRKDFAEIYRHAKMNGLVVTLFTNGTLITDEVLALFDDLPPRMVEISLYGATAATYERITGVEGSFERCMVGIQGLLGQGLDLRLKTILMTLNRHEFNDIEKIAQDLGVKFRFDAAIFPCADGSKYPLDLRVTPKDAVEKEFSDSERARGWLEYFRSSRPQQSGDQLYHCGAGLTGFHINPYGKLLPCLMANNLQYDLLDGDFLTGWRDVIAGIRERKAGAAYPCGRCEKRHLCGFCPAFHRLENGAEDVCSEYLCALGDQRFELLKKVNIQGVHHAT